jgi:hypothetical protein
MLKLNYYFLEINFFDYANIEEATIIPRVLRVLRKKFPLPVRYKK